jgi:hypothetical protein
MNTLHRIKRATDYAWVLLLLAALYGCGSGAPASHCFIGSEITIPPNDTSAPTIKGIDFYMPDGSIISRTVGDGLSNQITVPTNGDVKVVVVVQDEQGVKDSQLFAAAKTCSVDPATNTMSCSGPGLLNGPTANNPETNAVGDVGCTQRLAAQTVNITKTATSWTTWEISAKGLNFGGQEVDTPIYTLGR